ncbi:HupE/UreJ family protein [Novosphingobium sp. NDB2Meth1]|uniref:HupE/UreJ family protein n=1 Tax=Novosphingobium sp. NDB2Meth1 TaxID=1892847 RepID=UPI000930A4D4|nr:HupE/UreJ family protein [Novosphingobium sp. NDB2Meth1]
MLRTITAFTVAHSITLALTALRILALDPALVEAMVAWSILFLAVELVRKARGEDGLTQRQPWVVAFGFGLLHGAAFAGALRQIGLPQGNIPASLWPPRSSSAPGPRRSGIRRRAAGGDIPLVRDR